MFPLPPPDFTALAIPSGWNISCSKCHPLSVWPFSGFITLGFIYLNYLPSVRERPSPESLADCSDDTGCGETAVVVIVEEHLHRFRRAKYPSLPSWLSFRGLRGGASFGILPTLNFAPLSPNLRLRSFSSSLRSHKRIFVVKYFKHIVVVFPGGVG